MGKKKEVDQEAFEDFEEPAVTDEPAPTVKMWRADQGEKDVLIGEVELYLKSKWYLVTENGTHTRRWHCS